MNIDGTFRQPLYIGKALLIDTVSRAIIAEGYGQFDSETLNLQVSLEPTQSGTFQRLIVILQTTQGFFTPLGFFTQTIQLPGAIATSYNMDSCLTWPLARTYGHILETFSSIEIIVDASHYTDEVSSTIDNNKHWTELRRKAAALLLDTQSYRNFQIVARTGYSLRRHKITLPTATHAEMFSYISFGIKRTDEVQFNISDLARSLLAFKVYWINSHDYTDCVIRRVKLGSDITLILSHKDLPAVSQRDERYQSILAAAKPLDLVLLAKIVHFFFNPQKKRNLSSSSKIGLALARLVHHRFDDTSRPLDNKITDLIFSLQSMSESIAEGRIRALNRIKSKDTKEGIAKIMSALRQLEDDLPTDVRAFYIKSPEVIYKAIARPTFQRSLEITLEKLDIDMTEHQSMLKIINKARRQVVHSEGYSAEFLTSLFTKEVSTVQQTDDGIIKLVAAIEIGEIDKLYYLIRHMAQKYFISYSE